MQWILNRILTTFKAEIAAKKGAPVYLTRKIQICKFHQANNTYRELKQKKTAC